MNLMILGDACWPYLHNVIVTRAICAANLCYGRNTAYHPV